MAKLPGVTDDRTERSPIKDVVRGEVITENDSALIIPFDQGDRITIVNDGPGIADVYYMNKDDEILGVKAPVLSGKQYKYRFGRRPDYPTKLAVEAAGTDDVKIYGYVERPQG